MIDDGMPVARASLAVMDMKLVAIEPTAVGPKSQSGVDRLVRRSLIGVLVILLLPALVILSAVAILVPCFFRVPVCGTSQRAVRAASNR